MLVRGWRMSGVSCKVPRLVFVALLCAFWVDLVPAQEISPPEKIPPAFTADARFAARVRSQVLPYTIPATSQYPVAVQVMETLLRQVPAERAKFSWDLRIAKGAGNVFSSPDGTIFVDEDLARLLGSRTGLWAAALSHEISHVIRRDWARRYLLQKSLERAEASQIMLGDAGAFSGSWVDSQGASSRLASFCQTMELEADAEGLMLMTRAGYDPDFIPALHHLIEAQPGQADGNVLDPTHPGWYEREQRMQKLFAAAGKEYDRLWPERNSSPGGNSPILVYAGAPSAKRGSTGGLEVLIPLHCENLSGSVEVVLHVNSAKANFSTELRQLTGCTSAQTLLTFLVPEPEACRGNSHVQADVSVLDGNGVVLTRSLSAIRIR